MCFVAGVESIDLLRSDAYTTVNRCDNILRLKILPAKMNICDDGLNWVFILLTMFAIGTADFRREVTRCDSYLMDASSISINSGVLLIRDAPVNTDMKSNRMLLIIDNDSIDIR